MKWVIYSMKQKIICIGIIGLFLITGIAFPALGKAVEKDTPVEEDTSIEITDEDVADIVIRGVFFITIKIIPDKEIQNKNYKYDIKFQFNDEDRFGNDGFIKRRPIRYFLEPLFYLRLFDLLESRSGTVNVTVEIMKPNGDGWYETIQTVEKTGTFGRFFISFK